MHIREFEARDRDRCRELLDGLPEWFGIAEANEAYIASLGRQPSAVVEDQSGTIIGFTNVERHDPKSAELHVIAVDRSRHNTGADSLLLGWVEAWCLAEGAAYLHVKTRGPLTPDPCYERTRLFYEARGFVKLFESLELWGPQDSALVMVKWLGQGGRT